MFKCFLEYILDRSIFDLMEEIPKIEDASVQDIFQEAFEHLLSYCCQSDETLDLTLDTRNAKSHVISCFRQLCENNLIKQRLANQDKKFIFSNYDSGLKQSKQISKRMGKACLCDECLKSNKINLVNFKSDSFHVALKNIVLLIEQDKFQEAKALIEKIPNEKNKYLTADRIFRSVYYKIYDKYGILREFAEDPLWANLSEDAKKEAGSNPELAKKINMGFLKRRLEAKNKLSAKKTEAESKINEPIQSCMPEIKQENIPHAISQIKDQEQIPACAETGKEDLKTCGGASIKGAKSDIPVEVQEAKSDESSTKLKEVFGEPEIPAQKIDPEIDAPQCNSSKQRNVPDLVGEDVADKVAAEVEKESVEQKSETPEVDSEQEFKPAIKADEENTADQKVECSEQDTLEIWNKSIYGTIKATNERYRIVRPLNIIEAELKWAPKKYIQIRHCTDDVIKIAENTGWEEEKIKQIKDHLFYNKHKQTLKGVFERFDSDSEIAAAWDRLYKGDFVENDIKLLEHEYFELNYERNFNTDYDTAHDIAQNP